MGPRSRSDFLGGAGFGARPPALCAVLLGLAAMAVAAPARAQAGAEAQQPEGSRGLAERGPLSAAELTSFRSAIGGRDAPQWRPDGGEILFMTGMGGGLNVYGISPEGGFPRPLVEGLSLSGTGSPSSQKPQWSPDGRWIGYVSSKGGAPEIWLWSAEDGRSVPLTDLGGRVNALSWSPDARRIVFSNDRYGAQDIWTVTVPEGRVTRLTADPLYEVYPTWTPDGRHILYVRMDERWADHDVMEMPAEGGEARLIVEDRDFFDYRAGLAFGTPLPSPDGRTVMFRSLRSGWHNYWLVPRQGGEPRPVAAAEADQTDARWSPDGRRIAYVENHGGTYELRVAPSGGGEPRVLVRPDAMGVVDKPEWSPDGRRISYTYSTPTSPEDLWVVEVESGRTRQLTRSLPGGNLADRLVVPEKVTYPSTDGFQIPAYLYRPPAWARGSSAKVPGLIWAHGGPTSQWDDRMNAEVQYFVQRGYAVLMPNVRGSSGYGKAFEDANNECWGHCDLEDVRAGVEFLKTLPEVNPDKMGIAGTSYGGILSMAAVAFAPGLFQGAIPMSGYGDWVAFHEWNDELQHAQILAYEFGPWPEAEEVYRRSSPIYHAADVQTPTFIIHGEGQEVSWRPNQLPVPASTDFARALDQHYKIYRYKAYPNEGYYVYGRQNTMQKWEDMLEFFDRFLKDGAVDAARQRAAGGADPSP